MGQQDDDGLNRPVEGDVIDSGGVEVYVAPRDGRGRRSTKPGRVYVGDIPEETIEEIIRERLKNVKSLREIGREYGVSHETVRQWCGEATDRRQAANADALRIRAKIMQELDVVKREAWVMYEAAKLSAAVGVMKDALVRIESVLGNQARLSGAVAPLAVKADVQVTELTQEDLAIQAMINEAQAKAAAIEAQVERDFKAGA